MTVDLYFIVNVIITNVFYCIYLNGGSGFPALTLNHNHNHKSIKIAGRCVIKCYNFHKAILNTTLVTSSQP